MKTKKLLIVKVYDSKTKELLHTSEPFKGIDDLEEVGKAALEYCQQEFDSKLDEVYVEVNYASAKDDEN